VARRPGSPLATGPLLLVGWIVAFACTANVPAKSSSSPTADPSGVIATADPLYTPIPSTEGPTRSRLRAVDVRLVRAFEMKDPVAMVTLPDGALLIGQRRGHVWPVIDGELGRRPVLDLSAEVSFGGDRGLLGLALSPDGSKLYVSFTDLRVVLHVVEFVLREGNVVRGSRREVISIAQPTIRHHGGHMAFGPDGYLWMGTGDGSLGNDDLNTAQSLDTLLGKLLRIDPSPAGSRPYTIPADNPFVDRSHARPEIYAYGLRNPWRFSFDRATGDLWIGDVGQYRVEEIDFLPRGEGAGSNFGWSRLEGRLPFRGQKPRRHVPPLFQYPHDGGRCAVIGGYVYRGTEIEDLVGAYVYSDLCDGRIRALVQDEGRFRYGHDLGVRLDAIASFAEGPGGELWVLSLPNGVYRLTAK